MKKAWCIDRWRHRGTILPTVLVIAIVGALLIAVVFEMSTRFGFEDIFFRRTYEDQVIASSHIELAKGLLASRIIATGEAIHPLDNATWNTLPPVSDLDDIQVFLDGPGGSSDPLSVDEVINGRRVVMQVYDLTYSAESVPAAVSDEDRALLPAPLAIQHLFGQDVNSFINVGETGIVYDTRDPENDVQESVDLKDVGAYLIRVRLFNLDGRLIRSTEKAFFILARSILVI